MSRISIKGLIDLSLFSNLSPNSLANYALLANLDMYVVGGKVTNSYPVVMVLYLPSSPPPSLPTSLHLLPVPPILLSFLNQYIFWLSLAPQISQEMSY